MPSRVAVVAGLVAAGCWSVVLALDAAWISSRPATAAPSPTAATRTAAACLDATSRQRRPGFPARRALAPGHLIGEDDLDWSAAGSRGVHKAQFVFHYTACSIKAGDRVIIEETRALPAVTPSVSHLPFPWLITDRHAIASINAGTLLDFWQQTQPVARGVRVLALQCSGSAATAPGDCFAILDAAPDDVARFQTVSGGSLVVVVVTSKP